MNAMTKFPRRASLLKVSRLDMNDARDLIGDGVLARVALHGNGCYLSKTRAAKLFLTK
jgi:hypothetical protein